MAEVENPLENYLNKQNRRPSQIAMLFVGVLALELGTFALLLPITTLRELFMWFVLRWAVGEFFWAWMCADHIFSTVGKLRRIGMLEDLHQSKLSPREITGAIAKTTASLLAAGVIVSFVFQATILLPTILSLFPAEDRLLSLGLASVFVLGANTISSVYLNIWKDIRLLAQTELGQAGWIKALVFQFIIYSILACLMLFVALLIDSFLNVKFVSPAPPPTDYYLSFLISLTVAGLFLPVLYKMRITIRDHKIASEQSLYKPKI